MSLQAASSSGNELVEEFGHGQPRIIGEPVDLCALNALCDSRFGFYLRHAADY
jgi:hypothetical protein